MSFVRFVERFYLRTRATYTHTHNLYTYTYTYIYIHLYMYNICCMHEMWYPMSKKENFSLDLKLYRWNLAFISTGLAGVVPTPSIRNKTGTKVQSVRQEMWYETLRTGFQHRYYGNNVSRKRLNWQTNNVLDWINTNNWMKII